MTSPSPAPLNEAKAITATMPPLTSLSHTLAHFSSSPNARFQVVYTLPPSLARLPTKRLYILDSSFNPPTWAHMRMCLSALQSATKTEGKNAAGPKRLLLLLATKNADKAAMPAAFKHRLAMMGAFAEDLRRKLRRVGRDEEVTVETEMEMEIVGQRGKELPLEAGGKREPRDGEGVNGTRETEGKGIEKVEGREPSARSTMEREREIQDVIIDIGVTKEAMFVDKSRVIEESGFYIDLLREKGAIKQVHLTGYDTLIRLVDPKYYPPQHTLAPLEGLFDKHNLRVTVRSPPPREEQTRFLEGLQEGAREAQGWRREWAERIELVEGRKEGEEGVSSTKARECFRDSGSRQSQGAKWCSESVVEYVLREGLYLGDGTNGVEKKGGLTGDKQ